MNVFDKIFNRDIYDKLKKSPETYFWELFRKSEEKVNKHYFVQFMRTKKMLLPNMELRLDFGTLYFGYKLQELIDKNEPLFYKQFLSLKEIWLKDYVEKFPTLQGKLDSGAKMTQAEFERFFKIGEKI